MSTLGNWNFVHNSTKGKYIATAEQGEKGKRIITERSLSLTISNGVTINDLYPLITYSYPERGVRSKDAVRGKSGSVLTADHLPTTLENYKKGIYN